MSDTRPALTFREAEFRPSSVDREARTAELVWTTGATVRRRSWDGDFDEELVVAPDAVRLGRLNSGAPVLNTHGSWSLDDVLGVVVDNTARLEVGADGRGIGVAIVRFSAREDVEPIFGDVADGILRNVSVGYVSHNTVIEQRDGAPPLHRVTDWEPYEVSLVPMGADPDAHVRSAPDPAAPGRTQEDPMSDTTKGAATTDTARQPETPANVLDLAEVRAALEAARAAGRDEGKTVGTVAEQARAEAIRALIPVAVRNGVTQDEADKALKDPSATPEAFRARILDALLARQTQDAIRPMVAAGTQDETETKVRAIEDVIDLRCGLKVEDPRRSQDIRNCSLLELAEVRLGLSGIRTAGRPKHERAAMALTLRAGGPTTEDFPYILANSVGKVLRAEQDAIPEYRWYERFATRNDFPDFKTRDYPALRGMGTLPVVPEGADYVQVHMGEDREQAVAVKRGAEWQLTLEMMTNDDLGAFLRAPRKFARAAIVTRSAVMSGLLTTPQTMGDGDALFHANHRNLSVSGGAPDVTKLAELDGFLRVQYETDPDGNNTIVGMPAKVGFFAASHRTGLEQLYSPNFVTATLADLVTVPLSAENRIYVPQFTGTQWVLGTGDPIAMEYGYLQGEGGTVVTNRIEEKNDSLVYHARDVFGGVVLEWRAFASNPGA
jgi:phage head maturation protease